MQSVSFVNAVVKFLILGSLTEGVVRGGQYRLGQFQCTIVILIVIDSTVSGDF